LILIKQHLVDKAEGMEHGAWSNVKEISNNIAEGSGSFSDKEFASFLNIARRSVHDPLS
jgi:hypothetical protein